MLRRVYSRGHEQSLSGQHATFEDRAKSRGREVYSLSRALSTDSAAMIAATAYAHFRAGILADVTLNADPSLPLA